VLLVCFIISPESFCLQLTGLKMQDWREIDFLVKHTAGRFSCFTLSWFIVTEMWISAVQITSMLWNHNMTGRLLEGFTSLQIEIKQWCADQSIRVCSWMQCSNVCTLFWNQFVIWIVLCFILEKYFRTFYALWWFYWKMLQKHISVFGFLYAFYYIFIKFHKINILKVLHA